MAILDPTNCSLGENYDFQKHREFCAEERGLLIVYPQPNQLFIDLDTEEAYTEHRRRLKSFKFDIDEYAYDCDWSASGMPHRHVTITFVARTFTDMERIAMQAALGSDPIREFLGARRAWYGEDKPTCFFEIPEPTVIFG